jgi:hypothetical protein
MEAAKAFGNLKEGNGDGKKFVFAYLSGARTTQTPTAGTGFFSTPMWSRVKGENTGHPPPSRLR